MRKNTGETAMSATEAKGESGAQLKASVSNVAGALRDLHRALMHNAKRAYESRHGEIGTAGKLLQLLAHDPEFWWLRKLSLLMVDIDEALDGATVTVDDARTIRREIENLIAAPADDDSEFARKYLYALQYDPDVIMEHAAARKAVSVLPEPTGGKETEREKG